jgi:AraC-like DNA-binding protein
MALKKFKAYNLNRFESPFSKNGQTRTYFRYIKRVRNLIEYLNLANEPFRFSFKTKSVDGFNGFFHAHQGIELLYVHEGIGHVVLNQQIHHVTGGTLLCFQPFQLHRIEMKVTPSSPYVRTVLVFEPSVVEKYLQQFPALMSFFQLLWKGELSCQVFPNIHEKHYFSSVLRHFEERFSSYPTKERFEESLLFVINLLQSIRPYLENGHQKGDSLSYRQTHHAEKIMDWIEDHFMEEFHLGHMARDLHLSKHHISHLFRKATGSTVSEYLAARRIREACWLLKAGKLSIQEIGYRSGLPNTPYFCQLFKKHTGISPGQYRKQFAKLYSM